ncbi:sulfatase-like hydrolase/transferase [Eoetvoesiella caeni]
MYKKNRPLVFLAAAFTALTLTSCDSSNNIASSDGSSKTPNIVFVVMDDVGIDQMSSFGYGGLKAPSMPNMDAVAKAGVRFRNTWSMPECSPGRASFFVGRYPFRTKIYQAIGPNDVANAQVSPYDITVPKLLKQANYESAMFGKFHLAGPENNEAENATPSVLGWDYFYGWIGGLPGSIDTTAGGVGAANAYVCGFVPGKLAGGTDTGACYQPNGSCAVVKRSSLLQDAAGLQCLDSGGVFVPDQNCGTAPATLNFNRENAYYVSPLVIINGGKVEKVPLTDARARGYRTRIETDAAIDWVKTRSPNKPWMATLSYTSAHTPWQQPPAGLLKHSGLADDGWNCTATVQGRFLQDKMTEAMDAEFGRFMVETGLARRADDGSLVYDPQATNTVIVIVGDNGSLGTAVKEPFQQDQAKGTAYQTGVWDPLIIAGPQVVQPDREVDHMVNMVDLFQFFGELAGIDAHKAVPRTLDSVGILPYLTNPGQSSLRTVNFTMGGFNQQANGTRNQPCQISTSCTQIPVSKGVCEDNQGIWWGKDYTDASVVPNGGVGYNSCADVNRALFKAAPTNTLLGILPEVSTAIRNDRYKLVQNTTQTYDPGTDKIGSAVTEELYEINQAVPTPLLDTTTRNLLPATTAETQAAYNDLKSKLDNMLASEPDCPGDGNKDGVVNAEDLSNWGRIAHAWGLSSVYDFMVNNVFDGLTNTVDGDIIQNNLGKTCASAHAIY